MRLYLFRLSLSERGGPDLFDWDSGQSSRPSRRDYLKALFGEDLDFTGHGGKELKYGFAQRDGDLISGVIGKWVTTKKEADPADLWATTEQNHWEKAALFLNLEAHEQVVAVESKRSVGSPSSILKNFISALNEKAPSFGYKIDVFPVTSKTQFWEAVKQYPAPITSLTFDLVIPNPSDASGKTKNALKRLKRRLNANRYKGTASNKDGLNVDDPLVRDAADYAAAGGGEIQAKSDNEMVYDSRVHVASVEVPDEVRPTGSPTKGLRDMLIDKLKR